jgi:hypothetical protein
MTFRYLVTFDDDVMHEGTVVGSASTCASLAMKAALKGRPVKNWDSCVVCVSVMKRKASGVGAKKKRPRG